MSLATVASKYIKKTLPTGTHLVTIADMYFLRNATGEVQKLDGYLAIIVLYKSSEGTHEQMYIIDNGYRQKFFTKALADAGVVTEKGKSASKEQCVGKKLWISICECHTVNDDKVVVEDGKPVIDYYIFDTHKFVEGITVRVKGDPLLNNGIAQDAFISYRNISTPFIQTEAPKAKETEQDFIDDVPNFE